MYGGLSREGFSSVTSFSTSHEGVVLDVAWEVFHPSNPKKKKRKLTWVSLIVERWAYVGWWVGMFKIPFVSFVMLDSKLMG